jgi:hypothetical protein
VKTNAKKTNLATLLIASLSANRKRTADLTEVKLEEADYVRNPDGSIDHLPSRVNAAHRLDGNPRFTNLT